MSTSSKEVSTASKKSEGIVAQPQIKEGQGRDLGRSISDYRILQELVVVAERTNALSRRRILKSAVALAYANIGGLRCSAAAKASVAIRSASARDETIRRYEGIGDNWHMTWAQNDFQYASRCDGFDPGDYGTGMYSSRLVAIGKGPSDATFEDVSQYPPLVPQGLQSRYYGFGTLAVDGCIYQFLTHFHNAVKLIWSPDLGRTWRNQDGSIPVVWETREAQSSETMLFFEEPEGAFVLLSVLQMGRNYELNQDGYVYVYSPNGLKDGAMNDLVMFRVPRNAIRQRASYEFYAGRSRNGDALWTKDIERRSVLHSFPRGWVGAGSYSWQPSVTYNEPLGVYMMASWGWNYGDARIANLPAADRASYLGLWWATTPWGPWEQFHEATSWTPANDPMARAYQPQISPKWVSNDGKSFWLAWTDYQIGLGMEGPQRDFKAKFSNQQLTTSDWTRYAEALRTHMPNYRFNVQRYDLLL